MLVPANLLDAFDGFTTHPTLVGTINSARANGKLPRRRTVFVVDYLCFAKKE